MLLEIVLSSTSGPFRNSEKRWRRYARKSLICSFNTSDCSLAGNE